MSFLLQFRCQYKCPSSRGTATFTSGRIIGCPSPFFRLRGLITYYTKIHKVTWLSFCNLKMIYRNLRSQYKHLFQIEGFASGLRATCLHNFSSHCPVCQFCNFSVSVHRILSAKCKTFYEKLGSFSLFFLEAGLVSDKKTFCQSKLYSLFQHFPCSLVQFC